MSKKWYVLHTYSGYENKVKTNLEIRVETMGLENNVFAIEIPTEMVRLTIRFRAPHAPAFAGHEQRRPSLVES